MQKQYKSTLIPGILIIILSLFFTGCKKENIPPVATFTITPEQGDIERFFVFNASGCTDQKDAGSDLMVRWDWESDDNWDTQYSTNKIFQKKFSHTTTYTITLEVKNTRGISSTTSKQLLITGLTPGTLIDVRDGKTYNTIKIGDQWWMAENLNYETLDISWCYNDEPANCNLYGRLYSHPAIVYACPDGWHLPSDDEWKEMESYLGMSQSDINDTGDDRKSGGVGNKLKSASGWALGQNGSDESGFNAKPGGFWWSYMTMNNTYLIEGYEEIGNCAKFWSGTGGYRLWIRSLFLDEAVGRSQWRSSWRASIRCVKD